MKRGSLTGSDAAEYRALRKERTNRLLDAEEAMVAQARRELSELGVIAIKATSHRQDGWSAKFRLAE